MAIRKNFKDDDKLKKIQDLFRSEISEISKTKDVDIGVATDMFKKENPELKATARAEPKDSTSIRRDLLSRKDAVKQASSELSPQYASVLNKLKENIASTRQAVPQALGARGQTMGGLRSATETGLTR